MFRKIEMEPGCGNEVCSRRPLMQEEEGFCVPKDLNVFLNFFLRMFHKGMCYLIYEGFKKKTKFTRFEKKGIKRQKSENSHAMG